MAWIVRPVAVHQVFPGSRTEPTGDLSVADTMFGRCVRRGLGGGTNGPVRPGEVLKLRDVKETIRKVYSIGG